jgi:hypothetical protein
MKKFIAGFAAALALAVAGTATAAATGQWRDFRNDEVWCSIGKKYSGLGATCVSDDYGVIISDQGIEVTNSNDRVLFARGGYAK